MRIAPISAVCALLIATPACATTLNLSDFVLFAGTGPVTLGNSTTINSGAVGTNGDISAGTLLKANGLNAGNEISLGNSATISAGSSVTAGGTITTGTLAKINSGNTVIGGSNMSLGNSADLGGAGGGVSVSLGGSLTHGTGYTGPASLAESASVSLPTLPTLPAGGIAGASSGADGNVTNANLPVGTLAPGNNYGAVTLGNSKTLNLTAGTYHFSSFNMGTLATIHYDLTGGAITVLVDGDVGIGNSTNWVLTGGDASGVYWETYGDLSIGTLAKVYGTIYASGIAVIGDDEEFGNGGTYTGQFLATGGIKIGTNNTFNLLPGDHFNSEGGIGETPIPAALPLFASGLGGLGLLGWRRKRKARGITAA